MREGFGYCTNATPVLVETVPRAQSVFGRNDSRVVILGPNRFGLVLTPLFLDLGGWPKAIR